MSKATPSQASEDKQTKAAKATPSRTGKAATSRSAPARTAAASTGRTAQSARKTDATSRTRKKAETGKADTADGGTTKAKSSAAKTANTTGKAKPAARKRKESEPKSVKSAAKVPAKKSQTPDNDVANDEDKPKIAPAPMRPALRVAKRAEARRDKNQIFKVKTQIVYPAHGVGHITAEEHQSIAGIDVELFVIEFEHEKMKLRVPVAKAAASGMRNLSTVEQIDDAMEMLEGKARVKRTMWSRRAQEYEAKINSGDLQSVSEVVRDLFRADDQPEQSYSERQLFEQARERLGREVAAVRKKSLEKAIQEIHKHLDRKEKVPEKAEK